MKLRTCYFCGTLIGVDERCTCKKANRTRRHGKQKHRDLREIVLEGDPPCHWCGTPHADVADHVVPLSVGGEDSLDNLVPSCGDCNRKRKNNLGPPGFGGSNQTDRRVPRHSSRPKRALPPTRLG